MSCSDYSHLTFVEVALVGHAPVPDCTSEEEVLRVLAGGTDAFAGIYDPLMRNA